MSDALSGEWDGDSGVVFGTDAWISHVVGSSPQKAPGGGSWKNYWGQRSGRKWPDNCQIKGCGNSADLGAHIYIKRQGLQENFILPACSACNNSKEDHYDGANTNYIEPNAKSVAVWVERHSNTFE